MVSKGMWDKERISFNNSFLMSGNDGIDKRFLDMLAQKHGFKYNMSKTAGFDAVIRLVCTGFLFDVKSKLICDISV